MTTGTYQVPAVIPVSKLIDDYVVQIKSASARTIEGILENARVVAEAEARLKSEGPAAVKLFRKATGLSVPMLSKLKRVGTHYPLLYPQRENLPPSLSTLYTLVKERDEATLKTLISSPLSSLTRAALEQQDNKPTRQSKWTISVVDNENSWVVAAVANDIDRLKDKYGGRIMVRGSQRKGTVNELLLIEYKPEQSLEEDLDLFDQDDED